MNSNTKQLAILVLILLCSSFSSSSSFGENWDRFRGPNGQGLSVEKNLPVSWSESDYSWVIKLSGKGYSSPVVWGDKVFITSASEDNSKGWLAAYNVATGKELWKKDYSFTPLKMHKLNSLAASTPALDGKHIYSIWYGKDKTRLIALDHDGGEVWSKDFEATTLPLGQATSPIVYKDMVIFVHEQENTKEPLGKWIAVDKKNGDVRWSIEHLADDNKASYLVPCVYTDRAGKDVIVFCSKQRGVCGVDPSSGTIVWQVEGVTPARPIAGPVISGDLILNTSGGGGGGKGLSVVRPGVGADGKVETVYTLKGKFIPYVSTPIAVDGLFFFYHDKGNIACIDSLTGDIKWSEKPAGRFYSSPVYADGKLYCMDMDGKLIVLAAGGKFEMLGESDLGESSYSSVAMSNGRVFLRTFTKLICVEK